MLFVENQIIAGADWKHTEYISNYSAQEWTLKILLKLDSNAAITINTTAEGSAFKIEVLAANTAHPQGNYQYQYVFTNISTDEVIVPDEYCGRVEVKALLSAGGDLRTIDEIYLDQLYASRKTLSERDYVEINVEGKGSAKFKSMAELNNEIDRMEILLGIKEPIRVVHTF